MKTLNAIIGMTGLIFTLGSHAAVPPDYRGKPFEDSVYKGGPQVIPGRVECGHYDMGGEGVAYHDTDATNNGNGVLNQQKDHQRPHARPYYWNFRANEGVDLSYTKDFADYNHNQNLVSPPTNQFYIGWTDNGEWCNYTVNVKKAGTYKILALYGNETITFSEAGLQLLTLHYNKGNNFAYFDFAPVAEKK
jgi:hypothetical protein